MGASCNLLLIAKMALIYESNLHPPKRCRRRRSDNEFPAQNRPYE